jgi:hypothetical protein
MLESEYELMSTKIENNKLIVTIPLDLLKFAQENRDDPYVIDDPIKMAEYVKNEILYFEYDNNYRDCSNFEYLLDCMFDEAHEMAEDWLHNSYDEECDDLKEN